MKRRLCLVKVLSVMLMVLMLAGMVPAFADENSESMVTEDGFVYEIVDGEVTITDYEGNAENVVIPDKIDDLPVTAIGSDAFYSVEKMKSVTIPAGVESIGTGCFCWSENLEKIVVDKNNKVYDSRENCNAVIETETHKLIAACNKTVLPDNLLAIGRYAYWGVEIKNFVVPAGITSIEPYAYANSYGYESVKVDKDNAVYDSREGCNAIIETKSCTLVYGYDKSVIPTSVLAIGEAAFYDSGIENITIPANVATIGDYAFGCCDKLTSITIPSNVKEIGNSAFYMCENLSHIGLNEGLETIYDWAFNSTHIMSITIPASVEWISSGIFEDCKYLTEITVSSGNDIYDSREDCNAIIETDTDSLVAGCMNTTIPAGIKMVSDWAFYECDGLTSIELPGGLRSIGYYSFAYSSLKSISIPRSVTIIEDGAFNGCDALMDVYFEGTQEEWEDIEGLEYIPEQAKVYYEITMAIPTPEDYDDEDEFDEDNYDDNDNTSSRKSKRKNKDDDGNIWLIVGCVAGGVLVAVIVVVLITNKKKKTPAPQQEARQEVPQQPVNVQQPAPQNNDNT